jgi:hypothetical protein
MRVAVALASLLVLAGAWWALAPRAPATPPTEERPDARPARAGDPAVARAEPAIEDDAVTAAPSRADAIGRRDPQYGVVNAVINAFDFENFAAGRDALLARWAAGDAEAARALAIVHGACLQAIERVESPAPVRTDTQARHYFHERLFAESETIARGCRASGLSIGEMRFAVHDYLWAAADAGDPLAQNLAVFDSNAERVFADTGVGEDEYLARIAAYSEEVRRRCETLPMLLFGGLLARESRTTEDLYTGAVDDPRVAAFAYQYVAVADGGADLRRLRARLPLSAAEEQAAVALAERLIEDCRR